MTKILLNNEVVDLTAEEETKRLAEVDADKIAKDARKAEEQTKADTKDSARQKLIDGEPLTEDEAKTVVL